MHLTLRVAAAGFILSPCSWNFINIFIFVGLSLAYGWFSFFEVRHRPLVCCASLTDSVNEPFTYFVCVFFLYDLFFHPTAPESI